MQFEPFRPNLVYLVSTRFGLKGLEGTEFEPFRPNLVYLISTKFGLFSLEVDKRKEVVELSGRDRVQH